jgi:hypothetical protein
VFVIFANVEYGSVMEILCGFLKAGETSNDLDTIVEILLIRFGL